MAYTDEKMIYDFKRHRYYLTIEAANELCNIVAEFGGEQEAKKLLRSISNTIYNFIYSFGHAGNKIFIEFNIANRESLREVIFEAMMAQLDAHIDSGVNNLKYQTGINILQDRESTIERRSIAAASICIEAENILINGDGEFNLCFAGQYIHNFTTEAYKTGEF